MEFCIESDVYTLVTGGQGVGGGVSVPVVNVLVKISLGVEGLSQLTLNMCRAKLPGRFLLSAECS